MKASEILNLSKAAGTDVSFRKAAFGTSNQDIRAGHNRADDAPQADIMIHKMKVDMKATDLNSLKIRKFQEDCDMLILVAKMLDRPVQSLQGFGRFQKFLDESELRKSINESTASSWVPREMSANFFNRIQLALKVAPAFTEIEMPRSPFEIPRKNAFSSATLKTETTNATESSVTAGKMTLTASTIVDNLQVSYELDEDVTFAIAPQIRDDATNGIARGIDNACINGDTTATHMDSDITVATDVRKAFKGLRKLALANSYSSSLSTFTAETVLGMKASMGSPYGADPSQLIWIGGVLDQVKLLNLKDSSGNRLYLEFGTPGAMESIVVPGAIGKLAGSEFIISEFVREDLGASGVYNGSTTTRSTLLLVRKDCFVRGVVRKVMVETFRDIVAQVNKIVVSTRMDFQPKYDITTNALAWIGTNVQQS
jgi:hypothetical protein